MVVDACLFPVRCAASRRSAPVCAPEAESPLLSDFQTILVTRRQAKPYAAKFGPLFDQIKDWTEDCRRHAGCAPFRPRSRHIWTPASKGGASWRFCGHFRRGPTMASLFLDERRRSEAAKTRELFDDGRSRPPAMTPPKAFGLRAVKGEVAGYAHSTEISEAACAARPRPRGWPWARAAARWPPRRRAPTAGSTAPTPTRWRTRPLPARSTFCARSTPMPAPRSPRGAGLGHASRQPAEVEILRPEGLRLTDIRPMARLNVSVIVEENGRRESGGTGTGGRHGLAG
jgi:TldD protein